MSHLLGAIILAAGEGRRFGGPKALARDGGQSWLRLAVERIAGADFRWISVVLGAEAEKVRQDCQDLATPISWVINHGWERGRTGSIICGLSDMPSGTRGALVHQVDFPFVRTSTFRALAEAFAQYPDAERLLLLPIEGGRRGHPIIVGRDVWPEITSMGPDEPLRKVVHRSAGRLREVLVEDPGIHMNVNAAADITRSEDSRKK